MKTLSTAEKVEIVDLIEEITKRENSLVFERVIRIGGRRVSSCDWLEVSAYAVDSPGKLSREGLLPALRFIADAIRKERGEPSLAEELAAMIEADQTFADSPIVETGEGAACACGSKLPLRLERRVGLAVPWDGSQGIPVMPPKLWAKPEPGEIGTCPACGKSYRFGV